LNLGKLVFHILYYQKDKDVVLQRIKELENWYESLSRASLDNIVNYYHEDAYFKDPFNEFYSREKIKGIFIDMFKRLESPNFKFIDSITNNSESFISWDFRFQIKGRSICIHGSTHLKWRDGKVFYHRDYWDVGEEVLLKLPLVKIIYGRFRKMLAH